MAGLTWLGRAHCGLDDAKTQLACLWFFCAGNQIFHHQLSDIV